MTHNSALQIVLKQIQQNKKEIFYSIPSIWCGSLNKKKQHVVDLYSLIEKSIQDIVSNKIESQFKKPLIYGALVRTTTAYDFDRDNKLLLLNKDGIRETGTILRMILLLPILKKIGVTMIYLLPITLSSRTHLKGSAPSPYSIKNFFQIEKDLYDPMTGEYSDEKLDLQFQAFVEASHLLKIKILFDFIPRTASRDNDLILDHPDWFYWIKKNKENKFRPPKIPSLKSMVFSTELTDRIYSTPEVQKFLDFFSLSPNYLNPKKWNDLVKKIKHENIINFLEIIEKEFQVTTVPGFSDVINDPQPVWNDVTFLRLYYDHPKEAIPYLKVNQPPYVLFDVIKASRVHCDQPNTELWNEITSILPYYQKKFQIDGARIDMGHALPEKLEEQIMTSCLTLNKSFYFIAEELDANNSLKAKKTGYHLIIGNLWNDEPRWKFGNIKKNFEDVLPSLKLPIYACSEMPDTPRSMVRQGKKEFVFFSAVINLFLPHTVPFITSGFELQEIQPMNQGLDSQNSSLTKLHKTDLNYKKLAFFDYTSLHWNNADRKMYSLLEYCSKIRGKINLDKYETLKLNPDDKYSFAFLVEKKYLFLINSNLKNQIKVEFPVKTRTLIPLFNSYSYMKESKFIDKKFSNRIKNNNIIVLKAGEISVFIIDEV